MPFTIDDFVRARPYLYHLTARSNRQRIRRLRVLYPASALLSAGGRRDLLTARRRHGLEVEINGDVQHIRDQAPLHQGNIAFEDGWTMSELLKDLNDRVFFWPGSEDRVSDYGQRHFARYEVERPTILRVSTMSLLQENGTLEPEFCRFNSGSPRCSNGRKSPRGPTTFVACADAPFKRGQVVEVTFRGVVALPRDVQLADSYSGPWAIIS